MTSMAFNTWSSRPNFGYSSSGSLLPGSGCSLTRNTSRSLLWNKGKINKALTTNHLNTFHVSRAAEPIACAEVNSWLTVSAFRAAILKPPTYGFIPLFRTKRYHCLHYVVGPREFSWPLASCHALPVLVNERYDILWSGKKQKINTGAWKNLASGQTHTAGSSFQDEGDSSYRSWPPLNPNFSWCCYFCSWQSPSLYISAASKRSSWQKMFIHRAVHRIINVWVPLIWPRVRVTGKNVTPLKTLYSNLSP